VQLSNIRGLDWPGGQDEDKTGEMELKLAWGQGAETILSKGWICQPSR